MEIGMHKIALRQVRLLDPHIADHVPGARGQVDQLVGARADILRRAGTPLGWELVRRDIILDQSTVLSNNLSMFF